MKTCDEFPKNESKIKSVHRWCEEERTSCRMFNVQNASENSFLMSNDPTNAMRISERTKEQKKTRTVSIAGVQIQCV